nr:hypothetical protein [Tanacetum cinerariifolium]
RLGAAPPAPFFAGARPRAAAPGQRAGSRGCRLPRPPHARGTARHRGAGARRVAQR